MSQPPISKRSHPEIKKLRDYRDRKDKRFLFCEGATLIEELVKSKIPIERIFQSKNLKAKQNIKLTKEPPRTLLSDDVMQFVSDLDHAPGIIALVDPKNMNSPTIQPDGVILDLVLHRLQLPQNVGALLRTAEAVGVTRVFTTTQTADLYSPKAIRASSGSVFRLNIHQGQTLQQCSDNLKAQGVHLVAATAKGDKNYVHYAWNQPTALVVSSEGAGIDPHELSLMDSSIFIPMSDPVESLNVGVAAAVCLYEAYRQRHS